MDCPTYEDEGTVQRESMVERQYEQIQAVTRMLQCWKEYTAYHSLPLLNHPHTENMIMDALVVPLPDLMDVD
jgi:hypothetical protein